MGISGVDSLDHANEDAKYGTLTVGLTAVELKVGGAPLLNRKVVTMQPQDNKIYYGFDNTVTVATGTRVFKNQFLPLPCGPDITVYLIADGAGKDVRIGELA